MIEVEKKFVYSPENKERLTMGATFLGTEKLVDKYYDLPSNALMKSKKWLRSRNGVFELKIALGKNNETFSELESERDIRDNLGLVVNKDFVSDLSDSGYEVFCGCISSREKYKNGIFNIDLDQAIFDGFACGVIEIETMVENDALIPNALRNIDLFAKELGLDLAPTQGRVVHYLKKIQPERFKILLESGMVKNL